MKITSWSLSSSSQWVPSPSSWWWWGPSCAHGARRPTRKSKRLSHTLAFLQLSFFPPLLFLVLCHLLSVNEIGFSSLPKCSLLQKAGCLQVLKRLPQIQGQLQRPETTWPLDPPREAGAQAHGQVARSQPGHDRNTHPPHLAGHHAGWQRPGQQPPPAAAAQLLPWLVLPKGKDLKFYVMGKRSKWNVTSTAWAYMHNNTVQNPGVWLADRKVHFWKFHFSCFFFSGRKNVNPLRFASLSVTGEFPCCLLLVFLWLSRKTFHAFHTLCPLLVMIAVLQQTRPRLLQLWMNWLSESTQYNEFITQECNIKKYSQKPTIQNWLSILRATDDSIKNSRLAALSDWLVSTVPFRPRIRGQHVYTSRSTRDEA